MAVGVRDYKMIIYFMDAKHNTHSSLIYNLEIFMIFRSFAYRIKRKYMLMHCESMTMIHVLIEVNSFVL